MLIGVLATLLAFLSVRALVEPGVDRLGALVTATFIAWPLGAALGVWLSGDRSRSGRALAYGLALTLLGTAVVLIPVWLDLDADCLHGLGKRSCSAFGLRASSLRVPRPDWVRGVAGVAALILAPGFARLGLGLARRRAS